MIRARFWAVLFFFWGIEDLAPDANRGLKAVFQKLEDVERRFINIEESLAHGTLSGPELIKLSKERAEIEDIVDCYREYKFKSQELAGLEEILADRDADAEMKSLARDEKSELEEQLEEIENKLKVLMLPKDPRDDRGVILEIRAGTGGDEAGIFAADLLRMYSRYADSQKWQVEIASCTESTKGGFKEVVAFIEGKGVYSRLKFEMGVHRVQRIPETESQGRVHTSACTVAVLAEAEDVEVEINPADLKIDTYRSSGAGGQHVNTTDSAVRITHLPTGTVAECQDERSQHKNKEKAMKMLKSRIMEKIKQEQEAEISADRKSQVGSGDRSERIRTYNFPQGRMTDHRINLTLYKLADIMEGDLDEVLDALGTHHTAELLKNRDMGS